MGESMAVATPSQFSIHAMANLASQIIAVGKENLFDFFSSSQAEFQESASEVWFRKSNDPVPVSASVRDKSRRSSMSKGLPEFTLQDVSFHDTPLDCWVVIYDHVYDITSLLHEHPGGVEVILEYAGRDATMPFRGVGHSRLAEESLKHCRVGILVEDERLWSRSQNLIRNDKADFIKQA